MAIARTVLSSPAGVKMCQGRIKLDSVLLVGRDDARSADPATGRGVSTSHRTVGKRIGMSGRHVGTARRILEHLGLQVTLVRGRHLSPAERSAARATHGGYQEAAASARALTVPRDTSSHSSVDDTPDRPAAVDTFHLPRSGSVTETSHLSETFLTRASARQKAAPRPKPKRTPSTRAPASPRSPNLQRFAWHVAENFHLLESRRPVNGRPISPGALVGHRHIGQLLSALQRHRITPDRYTVASLSTALNDLIAARKIPSPAQVDARDRLAWFVWMIRRLHELTNGLTRHEQALADAAEAQKTRQEQQRRRVVDAIATEEMLAQSQDAAAAFFASVRRPPAPRSGAGRTNAHVEIVRAVIGTVPLHSTPPAIQVLVGSITTLHHQLLGDGWQRADDMSGCLRWTKDDAVIEVHPKQDDPVLAASTEALEHSPISVVIQAVSDARIETKEASMHAYLLACMHAGR